MSSLENTFRRCHSTVRGLRNSVEPMLGVRAAFGCELRDLALVTREVVARLDGPLARGGPGGQQLALRALGETVEAQLGQHPVRDAQVFACVDPPALAAQPLPVEQVRSRQRHREAGAFESGDRLAVERISGVTDTQ